MSCTHVLYQWNGHMYIPIIEGNVYIFSAVRGLLTSSGSKVIYEYNTEECSDSGKDAQTQGNLNRIYSKSTGLQVADPPKKPPTYFGWESETTTPKL